MLGWWSRLKGTAATHLPMTNIPVWVLLTPPPSVSVRWLVMVGARGVEDHRSPGDMDRA